MVLFVVSEDDTMTLTVRQIESAKPKDKAYKLSDGRGLYLFITKTGVKSWRSNYLENGKQKTITYGRFPDMSLADARIAHMNAKNNKGKPEATGITFKNASDKWLKVKLPTITSKKSQRQFIYSLEEFVYPFIGDLEIGQIKRVDLTDVVLKIQEQGLLETAKRVAGRVTAVFDYAQDLGIIESHPANNLTRVLREKRIIKPMPSIPYEEAGELLTKIETYNEIITRLGLLFLAHTFVRTNEIRYMKWSEIRDGKFWVIPAERMKMKKTHVVPLSEQALKILNEIELETGECEYVFASPVNSRVPVSENTFLFALYRLGYKGRMTGHGFRSLASTVLNELSPFSRDVIERQLAHKETDLVRAAYNRAEYLPQRIELMNWWSDWLLNQKNAANH